jgi:GTP-binding protein
VFQISALTREGCEELVKSVFQHVKARHIAEQPHVEVDPRFAGGEADDSGASR